MNTKVRITRGANGNYKTLAIQVLVPRYKNKNQQRFLHPIGTLTWQGDNKYEWYGSRVIVDCEISSNEHLFYMYKIAKYLNERVSNESPIEAFSVLGMEEHFIVDGMFISINDNGKTVFNVLYNGNEQTRIVAANELMAQRALDGMIKRSEIPHGSTLKLSVPCLNLVATKLNYNA